MAKATYSVVAVRPGRMQDYFAFNRGILVNEKGEDLDSNLLSISVTVDASTRSEAEAKVRNQYPDHSIDSAATQGHG